MWVCKSVPEKPRRWQQRKAKRDSEKLDASRHGIDTTNFSYDIKLYDIKSFDMKERGRRKTEIRSKIVVITGVCSKLRGLCIDKEDTLWLTSRLPVQGKSSVCMICMKYRKIILIIIITCLGMRNLYLKKTSRSLERTHARTPTRTQSRAHTHPPTAVAVQVVAVRWVGVAQQLRN